jgi:hypothetical protein
MKFFFPDSSDMVDPTFDFVREDRERPEWRSRQQDYNYAHEVLHRPPYDGILVSRSVLDPKSNLSSRYTAAQQLRFMRTGIREFFRLDNASTGVRLEAMGDCGAFSYVRETEPPLSVSDVIDFYDAAGFDYGLSVDHVILGSLSRKDRVSSREVPAEWRRRHDLTLHLADEFIRVCKKGKCTFTPVGVAQGWSPESYAAAVATLQNMGYRYVALGGLVTLKTKDILSCLERVDSVRRSDTGIHLLGVKIGGQVRASSFQQYGVISFDTTSPLRQAFKDDRDNYYTPLRTYAAIRVPQVDGTPKLIQRIKAGIIDQDRARSLEKACMQALSLYGIADIHIDEVIGRLQAFDEMYDGVIDRTEIYREILTDQPWRHCQCEVCRRIGIQVMIFRGAERHKRRGFHNLFVTYQKLQQDMELA